MNSQALTTNEGTQNWTTETEELLEKLRVNCVNLSEYHRKRYYYWKGYSKYFRIPILCLSTLNATASVGLQEFVGQKWISLTTCLLGLSIATITSLEMFLDISSNMDIELKQSKEYYNLAVDLYKTLKLPYHQRNENGNSYLNKKFAQYTKMKENSNLLVRRLKYDTIVHVPTAVLDSSGSEPDSFSVDFPVEKPQLKDIENDVADITESYKRNEEENNFEMVNTVRESLGLKPRPSIEPTAMPL
jgi:hypothetical protein